MGLGVGEGAGNSIDGKRPFEGYESAPSESAANESALHEGCLGADSSVIDTE